MSSPLSNEPERTSPPPPPSLAHNLGAFFGHIAAAIKTPVVAPASQPSKTPQGIQPVGREEKIESVVQPDGSVLLRRTIIEEVRVDASGATPGGTIGGTGVSPVPSSSNIPANQPSSNAHPAD